MTSYREDSVDRPAAAAEAGRARVGRAGRRLRRRAGVRCPAVLQDLGYELLAKLEVEEIDAHGRVQYGAATDFTTRSAMAPSRHHTSARRSISPGIRSRWLS